MFIPEIDEAGIGVTTTDAAEAEVTEEDEEAIAEEDSNDVEEADKEDIEEDKAAGETKGFVVVSGGNCM